MQTTITQGTKKQDLPEINLKTKGKLILKKELINQINFLHEKVGDIEWSGVLLYKIIEGSINAPETLVIEAYDLHLMDIGSPSFTSFELEYEDTKVIHKLFPNSDPFLNVETPEKMWRKGMIHTHHSMDTFFSPTDMDELQDNTPNHDIYLSLIVNKVGEYSAKTAFTAKTSGEYKVVGRDEVLTTSNNTYLCMIDMNIVKNVEEIIEPHVIERYQEVKADKAVRFANKASITNTFTRTSSTNSFMDLEVMQRILLPDALGCNITHAARDIRLNNIGKMLKSINTRYKKLSKDDKFKFIGQIPMRIVKAVNDSKSVTTALTAELATTSFDNFIDILAKEFCGVRKLSSQTFLKDLLAFVEEYEYDILLTIANDKLLVSTGLDGTDEDVYNSNVYDYWY